MWRLAFASEAGARISRVVLLPVVQQRSNVPRNRGELATRVATAMLYCSGIPACEQRLVYGGKLLDDARPLADYGIGPDATLHLVLRLVGGKGGFGALLRSRARASHTQNFDACRDLSGRRVRHINADKQLEGKPPVHARQLCLCSPAADHA